MKRLTLMRHAKSSWKNATLADFDRPLKKRGKRDAPAMGERLARRGFRPDRIVASPAKRAWRTAVAVAEILGIPTDEVETDDRLYGASAREILKIVRELDDACEHVMLFGHNPGFTVLASLLTGEQFENVPTAGVVDVSFDVDAWRAVAPREGALIEFDYPKRPVDEGSQP